MTHEDTLPANERAIRRISVFLVVVAAFLTLFAYQFEHHGLWGKLVNYNKAPLVTLTGTHFTKGSLSLSLYRPNGPDTYGSFVEQVALISPQTGQPLEVWGPRTLATVPRQRIHNTYQFQKVSTGPWGLVVPLSARATVQLPLDRSTQSALKDFHKVRLTVQDVSGLTWQIVVPTS